MSLQQSCMGRTERHIFPKHSDSLWLNCSRFLFYLQLESIRFSEVGKNNSALVCAILTVLCMFSLPHSILWNDLLDVSIIISFCKLETRSSYPQMRYLWISLTGKMQRESLLGSVFIGGVCGICIHQANNIVLSRCLHTSQESWNTRHRALYRDIFFMPVRKSILATA